MTKPTETLPQLVGRIIKERFNGSVTINEEVPTPEPLIPGRLTRPTKTAYLRWSCTGKGNRVVVKIVVYNTDGKRLDEFARDSARDARFTLGQNGLETSDVKKGTVMDYPMALKGRTFKYVSHTFTAWP